MKGILDLVTLVCLFALVHLKPQSRHFLLRSQQAKIAIAMGIFMIVLGVRPLLDTARLPADPPVWLGAILAVLGGALVPRKSRRIAAWLAAGALLGTLPFRLEAARAAGGLAWSHVACLPVYLVWALLAGTAERPETDDEDATAPRAK